MASGSQRRANSIQQPTPQSNTFGKGKLADGMEMDNPDWSGKLLAMNPGVSQAAPSSDPISYTPPPIDQGAPIGTPEPQPGTMMDRPLNDAPPMQDKSRLPWYAMLTSQRSQV